MNKHDVAAGAADSGRALAGLWARNGRFYAEISVVYDQSESSHGESKTYSSRPEGEIQSPGD